MDLYIRDYSRWICIFVLIRILVITLMKIFPENKRRGLTLIEILIALSLISIIAAIGFFALNPAGQFASARNTERQLHLQALMNSIRQNMADASGGLFVCSSGALPTSTKKMASSAGNYNIAPCLLPLYLLVMPFDPSAAGAHFVSVSDYDAGYNIMYNASTTQITLSAPSAELNKSITVVR